MAAVVAPSAATCDWAQQSQKLQRWKAGSAVEVAIGFGAGQEQSRFSVSLDDFVQECDARFSPAFVAKLVGKRSVFEHHLDFGPTGESPSSLELAMSAYENDSFTFLLRLDSKKRTARAVVFLMLHGSLRDADAPLSLDHFVERLQKNDASLGRDPLLLANCILAFYQYRSYSYVNWRKDLYDMESRLGVTERADVFKETGYNKLFFDYDRLNMDLAGLSRRAAETSLSVSTTLHQATALLRLAEVLESYKPAAVKASATTEEIRSSILEPSSSSKIHHGPQSSREYACGAVLSNHEARLELHEDHRGSNTLFPSLHLRVVHLLNRPLQFPRRRRGSATGNLTLGLGVSVCMSFAHWRYASSLARMVSLGSLVVGYASSHECVHG